MAVPWAFDTLSVSVAAGRESLGPRVRSNTCFSPLHTLDLPWRLTAQPSAHPNIRAGKLGSSFPPYLVFFLDSSSV